jgi:glutathione S-transferase
MARRPRVFGASYSVYVRIVRLVLEEKGVAYDLEPVDVFAEDGLPPDYLTRHPFGRIPAFEHDGFALYETGAITRYIDEAFEGPPLQPADLRERARSNQIISMADAYAYPHLVWGLFVERVEKPARGLAADEAVIAAALLKSRTCLHALSELMGDRPWLTGSALSLADLYLAPMLEYALRTAEGRELIAQHDNLVDWWARLSSRSSMAVCEAD